MCRETDPRGDKQGITVGKTVPRPQKPRITTLKLKQRSIERHTYLPADQQLSLETALVCYLYNRNDA